MKVFLSHSHMDAPLAVRVSEALRRNGLEVWNPDLDLLPGDNWAAEEAQHRVRARRKELQQPFDPRRGRRPGTNPRQGNSVDRPANALGGPGGPRERRPRSAADCRRHPPPLLISRAERSLPVPLQPGSAIREEAGRCPAPPRNSGLVQRNQRPGSAAVARRDRRCAPALRLVRPRPLPPRRGIEMGQEGTPVLATARPFCRKDRSSSVSAPFP